MAERGEAGQAAVPEALGQRLILNNRRVGRKGGGIAFIPGFRPERGNAPSDGRIASAIRVYGREAT